MKITFSPLTGPFAGMEVPESQLRSAGLDDDGHLSWPVHHRLAVLAADPRFAEYAVEVSTAFCDAHMPSRNAYGEMTAETYPTITATARLIDGQGRVYRIASTLGAFDGPKAWERTENNALSRLLSAVGLPATFDVQAQSLDMKIRQPVPSAPVAASKADNPVQVVSVPAQPAGVMPVPVDDELDAAPPAAPQDAEQGEAADAVQAIPAAPTAAVVVAVDGDVGGEPASEPVADGNDAGEPQDAAPQAPVKPNRKASSAEKMSAPATDADRKKVKDFAAIMGAEEPDLAAICTKADVIAAMNAINGGAQ